MKGRKLLMKKYNLYWTPCAEHCIDLMFEDIGKRESVLDLQSWLIACKNEKGLW